MLTDPKARNTGAIFNSPRRPHCVHVHPPPNGRDNEIPWVMNPLDKSSDKQLLQLTGGGWGAGTLPDAGERGRLILGEEVGQRELSLAGRSGDCRGKTHHPKGLPEKVAYFRARFAADGRAFVTTDKESEFRRLAYIDLATQTHHLTTSIKWDVEDYDLSPRRQDAGFRRTRTASAACTS